MDRKKLLLPSLLAVASIFPTSSANADTLNKSVIALEDTTKTASDDHGVMLNAKDATEPRQVEIGLPMSYTAVSVDGLPAVYYYWPNTTSNHWRGEQLLARQGLQNIATTAKIGSASGRARRSSPV